MKEGGTKGRGGCVCPSDCHLPLFGGLGYIDGGDAGEWVGLGGGWIRVIAP